MIVSISIEHRFVSRYCLPGLRQRPVQETAEVKTRAEADLGDDAWSVITETSHSLSAGKNYSCRCGKRDENLRRYEEIRSI